MRDFFLESAALHHPEVEVELGEDSEGPEYLLGHAVAISGLDFRFFCMLEDVLMRVGSFLTGCLNSLKYCLSCFSSSSMTFLS